MASSYLSEAGRVIAAPSHELACEEEERQRRKIEALRARRDARRRRFLNAHERMFGMDRETIEAQIAEKRAREEAEKEAERRWAAEQERAMLHLRQRETEQLAARQQERRQLLATWREQADVSLRKDAHLHSTDRHGGREGDVDPRLGPSSMQVFDGEDHAAPERQRMQALQQRRWAEQQMREREAAKAKEAEEDREYAEHLARFEEHRGVLEEQRAADERERAAQVRFTNETLAAERRAREERRRRQEARAESVHHRTLEADPWLNEDPSQRASALGAHRIRVDHFKGMTAEERRTILREQERQIAEHAERQRREREERERWGRQVAASSHYAAMLAREQALRREEERAHLRATLEMQMEQHRASERRRAELNTNRVTGGFFEQFGTSDR